MPPATLRDRTALSSLQVPGYYLSTMQRPIVVLALAACFILAGALLDGGYQRSTPGSLWAEGTIVDFERRHSRQVYPVFEFKDYVGMLHRVEPGSAGHCPVFEGRLGFDRLFAYRSGARAHRYAMVQSPLGNWRDDRRTGDCHSRTGRRRPDAKPSAACRPHLTDP